MILETNLTQCFCTLNFKGHCFPPFKNIARRETISLPAPHFLRPGQLFIGYLKSRVANRAGEPEPESDFGAMEPANFGGAGAGAGAKF